MESKRTYVQAVKPGLTIEHLRSVSKSDPATTAGTTLLRLCSISTSALRDAAPMKVPIVALLSCDLTVVSTSRLGAAAPAVVHELSRSTIHGVHGKRHPDPFRLMIARSSGWSQTYRSTRGETRTLPPPGTCSHTLRWLATMHVRKTRCKLGCSSSGG